MEIGNVRNFVIIAHIDHGKSTLADRFLELTGTVEKRRMREQYLDMNPLEREKGITIKMAPVRMHYEIRNPKSEILNKSQTPNSNPTNSDLESASSKYILNLIDTPGHVDFSYEVSRALAAVEGAILLVDATQGVQAQTIANLHLAQQEKLSIIPVVNKIDLSVAEVEKTVQEICSLLEVDSSEVLKVSGKTGEGVEKILETIVQKVPPPQGLPQKNLRALIFDSFFDSYQGVIAFVRIVDGEAAQGQMVKFMATGVEVEVGEVGIVSPERKKVEKLSAGQIGYIATGIKEPARVRVGDTITNAKSEVLNPKSESGLEIVKPLPGYKDPEPMVFASLFPENQDEYEIIRESLQKLKLNDASLIFEPEEVTHLGRGFRVGFLGMLHMEIIAERLRREYNISLVVTNPSVAFRVKTKKGQTVTVYSAMKMPESHLVEEIEEPWVKVEVITPPQYLGQLTSIIHEGGGTIVDTSNLGQHRLLLHFQAPLREIIVDFYDTLKSVSQGYASMSYEHIGFQKANLVRLDIRVAGEKIPAFSEMIPEDQAYRTGRKRLERLKELLPRELFAVALQAEVETRIIARETISALKKDVTGYLYGGDRTRKMKLWKKQQRGKKRLKETGRVDIPAEVYVKILKRE